MKAKQPAVKDYLLLHIVFLFYSVNGIFSKMASENQILNCEFLLFSSLVLFNLFIYAILWQQILKKIPLTIAFSNKSVTIIWGMLWGTLFFKEQITLQMIIGGAIIFFGVYLMVTDHE